MHYSPLPPPFKAVQQYELEILIFACSHNKCSSYQQGMVTLPCEGQGYECHIVTGDLGVPRIIQKVDSKIIKSLRQAMQLVYLMVY